MVAGAKAVIIIPVSSFNVLTFFYNYDRHLSCITQMCLYVVLLCDILQCNIINLIFVKENNHFYLQLPVGSNWCQNFELRRLRDLHLLTSKRGHGTPVERASLLSIFSLLYTPFRSRVSTQARNRQTDEQTTVIIALCPP